MVVVATTLLQPLKKPADGKHFSGKFSLPNGGEHLWVTEYLGGGQFGMRVGGISLAL